MLAHDLVRNRRAGHRDRHHVAARAVHGLADRFRHFVRLARRDADLALPVADGDERVEREAPAALHDLRDAVDRDHVLDEIAAFAAILPPRAAAPPPRSPPPRPPRAAAGATAATATTGPRHGRHRRPATATATDRRRRHRRRGHGHRAAAAARAAATAAGAAARARRLPRPPAPLRRRLPPGVAVSLRCQPFRTPARLRGLRRPPPSRGRDTGIQRGRTRPC